MKMILFVLKPHFGVILALIMTIFVPHLSEATEVDSYTYSHIELKDSKDIINEKVNGYVKTTLDLVNASIRRLLDKKIEVKDSSLEITFMGYWTQEFQSDLLPGYRNVISLMEHCILMNDCKDWPPIERIILYEGESIYSKSKYSTATQTQLAPVINLCGVRVGGDKLTHFFFDGSVYYNHFMSGATVDQIEKIMDNTENGLMGLAFTGVYSFSDIYVDKRGLEFFKKLFFSNDSYLAWSESQEKMVQTRNFDICDYVDQNWDERHLNNIYSKPDAIGNAIQSAIDHPIQIDKETLISRKYIMPSLSRLSRLGLEERWIKLTTRSSGFDLDGIPLSIRRSLPIRKVP